MPPHVVAAHGDDAVLAIDGRRIAVTNLGKPLWPELGLCKGDLIQYYVDVSPWLLPHLAARAMVMKRYPGGADGGFFFMKHAPSPRPSWVTTCAIERAPGSVIAFPVIENLASLVWFVNLGCIDLNPWYSRCDDVDRPDYLHFDLDPVEAPFERVCEVALLVREALAGIGMPAYAKTSGSRGIHVYVPIERGPTQRAVWTVSKALALAIAARWPRTMTAEHRIARRPSGRVLLDYNQNAWGRTLASVYSVRPTALATVSTPVNWSELERGLMVEEFRIDNVRARIEKMGDLFAPLIPGQI
jgi:bifunctional non-homologous end joining protein LigD